jgi:hypothetical protein
MHVLFKAVREPVIMPSYYGSVYMDFTDQVDKLERANRTASHDLLRNYAKRLPEHQYNVRGIALRGNCPILMEKIIQKNKY